MKPSRTVRSASQPKGFALVSAIFLLMVLVALGAFMLTFSNTQQVSSAQDIQGSRALAAARGGMQWAIGSLKYSPPAAATPCWSPAATLTLDGFTVSVSCTANAYAEDADSKTIYWIESTASSGGTVGGISYTERQISGFVEF
ncbi:MAG: hypothetical protein H6R18_2246 [Proteobacteria bacterium]|nr:hypothetical protein [Pseudomonadota bacterium]